MITVGHVQVKRNSGGVMMTDCHHVLVKLINKLKPGLTFGRAGLSQQGNWACSVRTTLDNKPVTAHAAAVTRKQVA